MPRPVLSLLISCTLVLSLNARVLYLSEQFLEEEAIDRENEVDLNTAELLQILMNGLSEGGKYSDCQEAHDWMDAYDLNLTIASNEQSEANWHYSTNISDYTSQVRDNVTLAWLPWLQKSSKEATKFYKYKKAFRDQDLVRKLKIITLCGSRPSPDDARMTQLLTQLETIYSSAVVTNADGEELNLDPGLTQIMETSRDYDELKWAWEAWRNASGRGMKDLFEESVELQNEAVKNAGYYEDLGQQWRACNYEEPEKRTGKNKDLFIEDMVDDLLEQIQPLYRELHAYVRYKLRQFYQQQKNVSYFKEDNSPIPAHLLGNMWSQEWLIQDLVQPFPEAGTIDVTDKMKEENWTVENMFIEAERFFTSLGLPGMTQTFWEKSMFVRPEDGREVVCHASAEDFSVRDDYRIKMCAEVKQTDLQTIHHEMGHIEYFMLYRHQPQIYRQGANSAFHEAIGDTIALSVMTPSHLTKLDLLPKQQNVRNSDKWNNYLKRDINFLMKMALTKIAFLPFGYLIDKWRWDVFSGKITKDQYNKKWWEYRLKYQGIAPPVHRSEADFDPGAKYHVAANVPYIRYFLSFIGQFQFQKALCDQKHHQGDLYTCDIYDSKDAGAHLRETLELGSSLPWPDVMKKMTGQEKFDGSALAAYFRPLANYLREYRLNHHYHRGWNSSSSLLNEFFTS